jgi:hypothetical protein
MSAARRGKIRAPNGELYTRAEYLGWVRLNAQPCHYGHIACAGWKRGPCSGEIAPPQLKLKGKAA